jgi:hypothetical protein
MARILLILGMLGLAVPALAGDACNSLPADPSLYYTLGIQPSTLTARSDDSVIADLGLDPAKGVLRRIAIIRTMIWDTLAYRLDSNGHITAGGTWRTGRVNHPTLNYKYQVVHWQDLDDSSFTAYFKGTKLCLLYYEN